MPSSISGSKAPAWLYAKALLATCAVLIAALEVLSTYMLKHDSATYARVSRQYAAALTIRPAQPGEPTPVLMVGNSLLLDGIDTERLQAMTSSRLRIYPIFLEATGYYDWFYGLQRLFREGSKPEVVVLGVGVNSFLEDSVRQDYVPLMLFDLRDTLGVASALRMDRTAASNFILAHSSVFWDTRSVLRTQILRHTIPHYRELVELLKPLPTIPRAQLFEARADSRLEQLRQLCQAHGAKLILLVPPTPYSEVAVREMTLAARRSRVDALVPIDPSTLSTKFYQPDELHLNSEGAALFTSALAAFLPQRIYHEPIASPD